MIYRFKIWFEDDEDIIRWIDMKSNHTFKDFHTEILKSINFEDKEPASFFLSNDNWSKGFEITLADMGMEDAESTTTLMDTCNLKDFINDPHQKFIYVNDFMQMWTLYIELHKIAKEEEGVKYPNLYKSEGKAPKQTNNLADLAFFDDNEFDNMADEILKNKGKRISDSGELEDYDYDEEDFDEEDGFEKDLGESDLY